MTFCVANRTVVDEGKAWWVWGREGDAMRQEVWSLLKGVGGKVLDTQYSMFLPMQVWTTPVAYAPFRYHFKSDTVTPRMRTNISSEDVTQGQSIGREAWSTEEDVYVA